MAVALDDDWLLNTQGNKVRQDDKYVYFVLTNGETITIQKSGGLTWEYV